MMVTEKADLLEGSVEEEPIQPEKSGLYFPKSCFLETIC